MNLFGKTKHLEFLVALGLLLGEFGDLHPAYILHLKRTLLADEEFSNTINAFAAAWQLDRSTRHDMSERLLCRDTGSLENKVRALQSMWAEARTLEPQRYQEVLELLTHTEGLISALDDLKSAWTSDEATGSADRERDEAATVCRRLLLHPSLQCDPGAGAGLRR